MRFYLHSFKAVTPSLRIVQLAIMFAHLHIPRHISGASPVLAF